jgi:probable rRNA maturation factor
MTKREVRLHSRLRKPPLPRGEITAFVLDVMGRLGLEGEIGLQICGERFMAELNRRYRGKRGPTDVLAFPGGDPLPEGGVYLGDLVIAGPVAARAAKEAGHPYKVEIKRLILHGILHLAGFDHETDGGAMERKERRLRKEWGIP